MVWIFSHCSRCVTSSTNTAVYKAVTYDKTSNLWFINDLLGPTWDHSVAVLFFITPWTVGVDNEFKKWKNGKVTKNTQLGTLDVSHVISPLLSFCKFYLYVCMYVCVCTYAHVYVYVLPCFHSYITSLFSIKCNKLGFIFINVLFF